MTARVQFALTAATLWILSSRGANPIVPASMADPHVRIFNDKAYLYSGWDASKTSKGFNMPSWRIYSSEDLVNWTLETTIEPTQTWVGNSTACWATDCVFRDGYYYFYFSNHNVDIGVLRASTPVGPFEDVLAGPLFPANLTGFKQYDPTLFLNDDDGQYYMVFGLNQALQNNSFYFAARLEDDMLGLAEAPRRIGFTGADAPSDDKPTLHKFNGTVYLSAGATYSTSTTPYGPFDYVGSSGDGRYGLQGQAHGNYFTWRNQWYHVWCYFVDPAYKWRQSWMTYLHYNDDGTMVDDEDYLDAHGPNGVGSYDAGWPVIQAAWYSAASNDTRKMQQQPCDAPPCGFQVAFLDDGACISFPSFRGLPSLGNVTMLARAPLGGTLSIRLDNATGVVLAQCAIPASPTAANVTCAFQWADGGKAGVANLVLVAETGGGSLAIVSFAISPSPALVSTGLPALSVAYRPGTAPLASPPSVLLSGGPITDERLQSNATASWLVNATQFAGLLAALGWTLPPGSATLYPGVQNVTTVRLLGGWNSMNGNTPQDSDIVYRAANGSLVMRWEVLEDRFAWLVRANGSITPVIVLDNVPWALAGGTDGASTYGCNMPPRDFDEYTAFIAGVVGWIADRFGADAASSWLWRVGTEPNTQPGHWNSTADAFVKTYIAAAAGVHSVLPSARVGLPNFESLSGDGATTVPFVEDILRGLNASQAPVAFVASSFYGSFSAGKPGYAGYDPARAAASAQALLATLERTDPAYASLPMFTFEHGTLLDVTHAINNEPGAFGGAWYAATAALASANGVGAQYCWDMLDWSLGGSQPQPGSSPPSDKEVSHLLFSSTLLLRAYARTAVDPSDACALVAPAAAAPVCGDNATLPGGWCLSPRTAAGDNSAAQLSGFASLAGDPEGAASGASGVPLLAAGVLGPAPAGTLAMVVSAFANDQRAATSFVASVNFTCPSVWGAGACGGTAAPPPALAVLLTAQSSVFDAILAEAVANGTNVVPAQVQSLKDMLTPVGLKNVQDNAAKWSARQAALLSPLPAADAGVTITCENGECSASVVLTTPTMLALWVGPGLNVSAASS